jgi:hypothetical protein
MGNKAYNDRRAVDVALVCVEHQELAIVEEIPVVGVGIHFTFWN